MRKQLVAAWLILLLAGIAGLFYYNEWKYSLPTPVPAGYRNVPPGTRIGLPLELTGRQPNGESRQDPWALSITGARPVHAEWARQTEVLTKPLFLHFFNPDCPCSRFNMPHFATLAKRYREQVNFAIVLMTNKNYTAEQIRKKFGLPYSIPVLNDSALAISCGVYSTPQAVIIDTTQKLFYRGNYNRSRYCSDEKSSYAKIALDGLLHHDLTQNFSPLALQAYGCQLPTCTR